MNRGIDSVLLLEDDALCVPDFSERWKEFHDHLPDDWQMLYLGGEYLYGKKHPPTKINEWVYAPYNVNRTHAFAIRGYPMLKCVYRHLNATKGWHPTHHIDHHLGKMVQKAKWKVYAPKVWLVGQNETKSDVNTDNFPARFWQNAEEMPQVSSEFVAVVGLHRSGSSCLAGCLHAMGVHMGNVFTGCEANGGYEAKDLANICEKAMPFPGTDMLMDNVKLRKRFGKWIAARTGEAQKKETMAGGKYPHLCALLPAVKDICGEALKVVHIDRPIEDSIASLIKRESHRHKPEKLEACQRFLYEEKTKNLAEVDHITVNYIQLVNDPYKELSRIVEYLGLEIPDSLIVQATEMVDGDKMHFKRI
jgi:hypothetical protein